MEMAGILDEKKWMFEGRDSERVCCIWKFIQKYIIK